MKRVFFSIIIVLLTFVFHPSVSAFNETDGFFCTDVTVTDSGGFSAEIYFSGDITVSYIEFTLVLPDGIYLRSFSPTENSELISENGKYRFVMFSADGVSFTGGKKLMKLFLAADEDLADGEYAICAESIKVNGVDDSAYAAAFSGGSIKIMRNPSAQIPDKDEDCRHSLDGWTVISQPDYDKSGKRVKLCRLCGEVCKTVEIPAIPRYSISDTDISFSKTCFYTGKALKPQINISYKGVSLREGDDFTVTYRNNKAVGTGSITVKGTGSFEGEITLDFSIKPKPTSVTGVRRLKNGKVKIRWKKAAACDGYRIYVRYPGKKGYKLLKTVKNSSVTAYTTSKLKSEGRYRFRIRTYVSDRESRVFSSYSKIKVSDCKFQELSLS